MTDSAVEAARDAVAALNPKRNTAEDIARVAIEAAMPAIREALAQEIEDAIPASLRGSRYAALKDAASIVRGGTP